MVEGGGRELVCPFLLLSITVGFNNCLLIHLFKQNFVFTKTRLLGYTSESRLPGVGYTGESRLSSVGYTGEYRPTGVAHTGEVPSWLKPLVRPGGYGE